MRRAVAFLTPLGGARAPSPGALDWFPIVGAAIGLAVGGVWWLAGRAWPATAAAAMALATDVALTGYLHLDGLADSADGLLPPMPRERRLEVMTDPRVGSFGAVTLITVLVLRFSALASTAASPLVVGALWCGSRSAMAVVARVLPYVRPGGLASAFVAGNPEHGVARGTGMQHGPRAAARPGLIGLALALSLAITGHGAPGLAIVASELVAVAAVVGLAWRRIGGFTGDVLGAAGVVGETVGLLVLAARW
jgi:adenosylcobinamide-GDP ribazoletransferase